MVVETNRARTDGRETDVFAAFINIYDARGCVYNARAPPGAHQTTLTATVVVGDRYGATMDTMKSAASRSPLKRTRERSGTRGRKKIKGKQTKPPLPRLIYTRGKYRT